MLAALQRHYGPLQRRRVIPNGRDPNAFAFVTEGAFCLGGWAVCGMKAKNLQAWLAIAPDLPWPVYVAGEMQHPDKGRLAAHTMFTALGTPSSAALAPGSDGRHLCAAGAL